MMRLQETFQKRLQPTTTRDCGSDQEVIDRASGKCSFVEACQIACGKYTLEILLVARSRGCWYEASGSLDSTKHSIDLVVQVSMCKDCFDVGYAEHRV